MKRLLLLCIVLMFCACANSNIADRYITTDLIEVSSYAFVLAKVSGTQHEHLTWLNSQKKFAGKYDYTESINMKPGEYKLYQVVPGVYSIVDFYLDRNHTTYSANDKGRAVNEQMLANSRSLWGAFTATAGRITYIGDLNFYTDNGVKLDSNLHVDKATEFIHKNYINISNVESIMVNHAAK